MASVILSPLFVKTPNLHHIISILADIRRTGFLIGDLSALQELKKQIPPEHQHHFNLMLQLIVKREALAGCDYVTSPRCAPANVPCDKEKSAADIFVDDKLILITKSRTTVPVINYAGSAAQDLLTENTFTLPENSSKDLWEQKVFAPVIRFAKRLSIIDPYVGQSFDDFHTSLNWIREIDRRIGLKLVDRELFTTQSTSALQSWCRTNNFKLITCRKNSGALRFPHDRYLISNSLGFQIGRGFNLLHNNGLVAESYVGFLERGDGERIRQKCFDLARRS